MSGDFDSHLRRMILNKFSRRRDSSRGWNDLGAGFENDSAATPDATKRRKGLGGEVVTGKLATSTTSFFDVGVALSLNRSLRESWKTPPPSVRPRSSLSESFRRRTPKRLDFVKENSSSKESFNLDETRSVDLKPKATTPASVVSLKIPEDKSPSIKRKLRELRPLEANLSSPNTAVCFRSGVVVRPAETKNSRSILDKSYSTTQAHSRQVPFSTSSAASSCSERARIVERQNGQPALRCHAWSTPRRRAVNSAPQRHIPYRAEKDEEPEIEDDTDEENATPGKFKDGTGAAKSLVVRVCQESNPGESSVKAMVKRSEAAGLKRGLSKACTSVASRFVDESSEDEKRIPLSSIINVDKAMGVVADGDSWRLHPFALKSSSSKKSITISVNNHARNVLPMKDLHEPILHSESPDMFAEISQSSPPPVDSVPPPPSPSNSPVVSIDSPSETPSPLAAAAAVTLPSSRSTVVTPSRHPPPDPQDKRLRKKYLKGGLAERLVRLENRQRSDVAFWSYNVKKTNGAFVFAGNKASKTMKVQVLTRPAPMGCVSMTTCRVVKDEDDDQSDDVIRVLFSRETVESLSVTRGVFVTIASPWQSLKIDDDEIILCTDFCFINSSLDDSDLTENIDTKLPVVWRNVVSAINVDCDENEDEKNDEEEKRERKTQSSKSPISEERPFRKSEPVTTLWSEMKPSDSATVPRRYDIVVHLVFAVLASSSSTLSLLHCLDSSSSLSTVLVPSLDSLSPSVVAGVEAERRLSLLLEGVALIDGAVVIDVDACIVEAPSGLGDFPRPQFAVRLPDFLPSSRISDLVSFTGRVIAVDYDNAFSERACPDCGRPIDDDGSAYQSCHVCVKSVTPVTRVTLHLMVASDNVQEDTRPTRLKLSSDFALTLLPPVKEGRDYYDIEAILSRRLTYVACLVEKCDESDVTLQQIRLFS